MRKLASIQRIIDLQPIPDKDRIEIATVLGWTVIVLKGQFKIGDLCVYIEYDSILPEEEKFEFLRSRCYSSKWNGYRIKYMKMAGIYSQGIVFRIDELLSNDLDKWLEGKDVTEILGIKKYDPEEYQNTNKVNERKPKNWIIRFLFRFKIFKRLLLENKIKLPFPTHLCSKTDETRIQAVPFVLKEFEGEECYISEKIDGCSTSYTWDRGKFIMASRNICVVDKKSHYYKIAEKYNLKEKLREIDYVVQGEIVGPGIANGADKNIYQLNEIDLYVFNIIDKKTRKCLSYNEIVMTCNDLGLKMVPVLETTYRLGKDNVQELLELSKGKSQLFDVEREGIVIRDLENKYRSIRGVGDSLSFKVINPDYLLKYCNK